MDQHSTVPPDVAVMTQEGDVEVDEGAMNST